jgi:hypothetical protein
MPRTAVAADDARHDKSGRPEPTAETVDAALIKRRLAAPTDLKVERTRLVDVMQALGKQHGIPIRFDMAALKRQGVTREQLIDATLADVTLQGALLQVLKPLALTFRVTDEAIVVTDGPAEKDRQAAEKSKLDAAAIKEKLVARTTLKADAMPLAEALDKLGEQHGIPIRFDDEALKRQGVTREQAISTSFTNFTLRTALVKVLRPLKLQFQVLDGAILITDAQAEPEQPQARAVRAAAAQPAAVAAADVIIDALQGQQQQFARQYRSIARSELHLARKICEPTAEQFQQLREDVEQTLRATLEQQTDRQKKVVAQRRGQQQALQLDMNNCAKLARDAVAHAVKAQLSAEQADRFSAELAQRAVDRRETAAHNFVARLDQELVLSVDQRTQITAALLARWDDSWCQSLQMFMYDEQGLPNLPEAQIAKFLSPAQKKIWTTIPKNQGTVFFGGGFLGGLLGNDVFGDVDIDADVPAAVREE